MSEYPKLKEFMATARLFEHTAHAHLYSRYRPTYPKAVVSAITDYVTRIGGSLGLAVDVACGSGQSTFYLKEAFKKVIGVDISKAQIEEANRKCKVENVDNIEFQVGNGMNLSFEDESVDMVTIAQALHWLDRGKFFAECKRVLKHKGCLAVYGYGNVHVVSEQCNALVSNFYRNSLKGCWHEARYHIDNEYRSIQLPFSNTHRIDMTMPCTTSLEAFMGYLSTWSGYQKYCEDYPDNTLLKDLNIAIREILESTEQNRHQHTASEEQHRRPTSDTDFTIKSEDCGNLKVEAYFPVFILLGQKV